ncbi:hypothetical protein [Streptomyces sp. NPDC003273]|uniref:hypothetical protein n=1 Tax=Streptomyces sp. NPDC003273 TaxID=3364678 RepID=UPI0036B96F51
MKLHDEFAADHKLMSVHGWIHHSVRTASTGGVVGVVWMARLFLAPSAVVQGVRHGTQQ